MKIFDQVKDKKKSNLIKFLEDSNRGRHKVGGPFIKHLLFCRSLPILMWSYMTLLVF